MPSKVAKENSTTLCLQYPPCLMDAEEHQLCPVCAKWNRKTYRRTLERGKKSQQIQGTKRNINEWAKGSTLVRWSHCCFPLEGITATTGRRRWFIFHCAEVKASSPRGSQSRVSPTSQKGWIHPGLLQQHPRFHWTSYKTRCFCSL